MTDNSSRRTFPRFIARYLRTIADRIDPAGAPSALSMSFTFEDRTGIVFRDDGRGCRLRYLGDAEYERAHDEAGPVATGSAEVWLPQRLPAGTVLTGRRKDPEWTPARPLFAVTFSAEEGGSGG